MAASSPSPGAPRRVRVAVLYGGRSGEHEISLQSAASVLRNLDRERFEAIPIAIDKEGRWHPGDVALIDRQAHHSMQTALGLAAVAEGLAPPPGVRPILAGLALVEPVAVDLGRAEVRDQVVARRCIDTLVPQPREIGVHARQLGPAPVALPGLVEQHAHVDRQAAGDEPAVGTCGIPEVDRHRHQVRDQVQRRRRPLEADVLVLAG